MPVPTPAAPFNAGTHAVTGIDHVIVGVRDLEAAAARWTKLGFHLTPRGRHIGWGTGNYCIMFAGDYIELLGIIDPQQFTNNLEQFVKTREGLLGLAFAGRDEAECARELRAANLPFEGPKVLKRELELPEGTVLPEFGLIMLPPAVTPGLSAFVTVHKTPELLRQPEWLRHANRATGLVSMTVVVDDPVDTAFGWLPVFGPNRISTANLVTVIDTGHGAIRFTTKAGLAQLYPALVPLPEYPTPWIAALKISVADKARCRDHLHFANILAFKTGKGCIVPPEEANGVIIEFVQE
ncbi:VOC family protein [Dongia rigui]|uniref:VOC family protein n=1 Tax=Dongia rigui TaxID=940149 RepID=A0ABU5DYN5_9PROT|nr:VOC family protein [Dongia rigui]MDY0872396.1 VOC family protein [Dongia rigui]